MRRCEGERAEFNRLLNNNEPVPPLMLARFQDCVEIVPQEVREKYKLSAPCEYQTLVQKLKNNKLGVATEQNRKRIETNK